MRAWASSKGLVPPSAAPAGAQSAPLGADAAPSNVAAGDKTAERPIDAKSSVQNDASNEEERIRSHVPVTTKVPVEKETAEDRARLAAKFASKCSSSTYSFLGGTLFCLD